MLKLPPLALLALLALPTAASGQAPPHRILAPLGSIAVSGIVLDETTGLPLGGVAVSVSDTELGTLTGADGRYTIREVPNRNAAIRAQRLGYIPEVRALWVCSPSDYPGGRCVPAFANDQEVRFYMRPAPRPVP